MTLYVTAKRNFVRFFSGSGHGKLIWLLLVVAIILWGLSGFYRVNTTEQGVVLRFGAWVRTTQPGLHYHIPRPIEMVLTPDVTTVNRWRSVFVRPARSGVLSPHAMFPKRH